MLFGKPRDIFSDGSFIMTRIRKIWFFKFYEKNLTIKEVDGVPGTLILKSGRVKVFPEGLVVLMETVLRPIGSP